MDPQNLLVSQSSQNGDQQANDRACLKENKIENKVKDNNILTSSPRAFVYLHAHAGTCTTATHGGKNKDTATAKNFNDFSIQFNGKPGIWL